MSSGAFAMVAGLIRRGSTKEGAARILSSLQGSSPGFDILGDQTDALSDVVAQSSGVRRESAMGVLAAIGPIAAAVIGQRVAVGGLDADGLTSFLHGQKRTLLAKPNLPTGIAGMLSGIGPDGVAERAQMARGEASARRDVSVVNAPRYREHVAPTPSSRTATPWGVILGALALGTILLIGGLFLIRSREAPSVPEAPRAEAPAVRAPEPTPALPGAVPEVPGEATITSGEMKPTAPRTSAEEGISEHFLGTGALPEAFVLPNVEFPFASATIAKGEGGEASVKRLAELLEEHPSARIRLEGYTDATGDNDVNAPLSYRRAEAVKRRLVAQGIDPRRIETVGRRDTRPIASNDTKAGRLENRRVEVVILSR
jgi:OmpA-OmpF porin, OOP family